MPTLIQRFSGIDRYTTAVDIAKETNPNARNIYIASGELFADALVAGPAAAKDKCANPINQKRYSATSTKRLF